MLIKLLCVVILQQKNLINKGKFKDLSLIYLQSIVDLEDNIITFFLNS